MASLALWTDEAHHSQLYPGLPYVNTEMRHNSQVELPSTTINNRRDPITKTVLNGRKIK